MKLAQKTTLLTVFLTIVTTTAITLVFYQSGKNLLIKHAMEDLSSTAYQEKSKIQAIMEELKNDTLFLAGTPPVRGLFRAEDNNGYDKTGQSTTQQWHSRLENIFTTLLHAKPHYLQARFISTTGHEVIRVENKDGQIVTIPKEGLQNKSRESYTSNTLALSAKEIFLSKITLNREFGQLTTPHTPVIRSATPVTDEKGITKGFIIINLNFGKELAHIEQLYRQGNNEIFVANSDGHYLVHPDEQKRFGFELGHRYRVHEDHPRLAKLFIPGNKQKNITLLPHKAIHNAMVMVKLPLDELHPDRYLALIIARPYIGIIDEETSIIQDNLWIGLIIILISAIATYLFALRVVRPLKQITQGVEDFTNGKSEWALPDISKDEIGILSSAFANMMNQVIQTQGDLKDLNKNLTNEVESQTRDLNHNIKILNAILENLPLMMFMKDAEDLRFVRFNKAGEDLLGVKRDDIIGKSDYDFFPKEQADFFINNDRKVIESGNVVDIPEEPIQTHNGERTLHTRKTVITDEDGQPLYLLGISEDITDRIAIERSLTESEMRLRAVVDTMVDALITINTDGSINSLNPATMTMFGYGEEELIGKNVNILMPDPFHTEHDQYLKNYVDSGIKKIIGIGREVIGLRKNGEQFPIELAVSEARVKGQRIFIGVVRDITERNRIDKMKNEFISTVSHELRTPLTSIRGSLGLINGGAVGEVSTQTSSLLKIAHKNTERLLLLINDILDLQKIESGNMPFNFEDLSLQDFIAEAVESNKPYAYEQEVTLVLNNKLKEDISIFADKGRLIQVMNNLLSNAAKFSPSNSEVIITLSLNDDMITIAITDHGPGIPENFRDKLFEKFTQSDSSDTRNVGGTGLGLSIAKLIIEKHNGSITYNSTMGVGTTFTLSIPTVTSSIGSLPPVTPDMANTHDILIVEDDPDIASLLALHLKHAGYHSQIAHTAAHAKELLSIQKFKAITLDLILPDEDGISLIKQLRSQPEFQDMPIIVISVKADAGKKELNGGAVGIIDWLSKPFDTKALERALHNAIHASDNMPNILYIEDDQDIVQVVKNILNGHALLSSAHTLAEARQHLKEHTFDLILLDVGLPDGSGLELLADIKTNAGNPPVIIFSANEIATDEAQQVSSVLVKSQTSNLDLLETIKQVLNT